VSFIFFLCILLAYLGAQSIEEPFIQLAQGIQYYTLYFLVAFCVRICRPTILSQTGVFPKFQLFNP
jgi:hypothetical protein